MLVVGDQDLRLTKGQEKSSRHRKVEAMIAEGAPISIVRESDHDDGRPGMYLKSGDRIDQLPPPQLRPFPLSHSTPPNFRTRRPT
jgi:hypothetical protein